MATFTFTGQCTAITKSHLRCTQEVGIRRTDALCNRHGGIKDSGKIVLVKSKEEWK